MHFMELPSETLLGVVEDKFCGLNEALSLHVCVYAYVYICIYTVSVFFGLK